MAGASKWLKRQPGDSLGCDGWRNETLQDCDLIKEGRKCDLHARGKRARKYRAMRSAVGGCV
jgi:hypothetical protein